MTMDKYFTLKLDQEIVRFTPDGKVSVLDAIGALFDEEQPDSVWQKLKEDHPAIADLCQGYDFRPGTAGKAEVVDIEGWEIIEDKLLDYILAQSQVA
jgi:hypothetical protein